MSKRRIWCHWQNLNEKGLGRTGHALRHGRAWLHWGKRTWQFSWNFLSRSSLSIGLQHWHDPGFCFHVSVPYLFSLFFFIPLLTRYFARHSSEGIRCEISIHGGKLWIHPWSYEMSWSPKYPWWRRGITFDPIDFLLGRTDCKTEILSETKVVVPMPEGNYPGTVKIERRIWTRKRWPRIWRERISSWIDMEKGIPHAGKGENSWDCGDDGLWGCGSDDPTPEAAIAAAVKSVLRDRKRYGMPSAEALATAELRA